jgi:putative spermidine/putrescine transport system permease protein
VRRVVPAGAEPGTAPTGAVLGSGRASGARAVTRRRALGTVLLLLPVAGLLVPFFFWPLAKVVGLSLNGPPVGLQHYETTLTSEAVAVVLVTTVRIALSTTLLCLLIALPYAHYAAMASKRKGLVLIALSTAPLWTIAIVRLYAWTVILGRRGLINEALIGLGIIDEPLALMFNEPAVVVGMTHLMLPFMILILFATIRDLDRNLLDAASTLGASRVRAFIKVYLPLVRSGIVTGCTLVFVISLGFYITPAILGGGETITVATYIEKLVNLVQWGRASAVSVVLLTVTLVLVLLTDRFVGVKNALVGGSRR